NEYGITDGEGRYVIGRGLKADLRPRIASTRPRACIQRSHVDEVGAREVAPRSRRIEYGERGTRTAVDRCKPLAVVEGARFVLIENRSRRRARRSAPIDVRVDVRRAARWWWRRWNGRRTRADRENVGRGSQNRVEAQRP